MKSIARRMMFLGTAIISLSCGTGEVTAQPATPLLKLNERFKLPVPIKSLAFSPDGKTLAAATTRGGVVRWDTTTGAKSVVVPDDLTNEDIFTVAFSNNGKWLAVGSSSKQDPGDGALRRGSTGRIRLVEVDSGKAMTTLEHAHNSSSHSGEVVALVFSADDGVLISHGLDRTVKVWEIPSLKLKATLVHKEAFVGSLLAISRDGTHLALVGNYPFALVWALVPEERRSWILAEGGDKGAAAFDPNQPILATGDLAGSVVLWNMQNGKEIRKSSLPPQDAQWPGTTSMAYSADGKTLAVARQHAVWFLDAKSLEKRGSFPFDFPNRLAYSKNGRLFAVGDQQGVSIFDSP